MIRKPETGPELRAAREQVKLTILDVAVPLGVGKSTLWEWETETTRCPEHIPPRYRRVLVNITRQRARTAREICQGKGAAQ